MDKAMRRTQDTPPEALRTEIWVPVGPDRG
jgi:hypothetical protein